MFYLVVQLLIGLVIFDVVQCNVYRLPKSIKPLRYILTMEPHLQSNLTEPVPYEGNIIIELKVTENTNDVTFHKKTFRIDNSSIAISSSNNAEVRLTSILEDEMTETFTIHLENELIKGQHYNLTIENFSGYLAKGEGFFLVKYTKTPSSVGSAAVTHFEPSGARTAFPCFDEPALKANFIIRLIRREGYSSVSNEELDHTENLGDGRFMDTFKETPKISPYLVAFAVSQFISSEKVERQRIFVRPSAVNGKQLNYSMAVAIKTLETFEQYTGINLSLSKLDHFAVPETTFNAPAMENWGLITYIEQALFNIRDSPELSEQEYLKRCTLLIVHEIVHQWFGNLVTPEWWDYIWLSESFAAYFQYYTASFVQPSWRLMDQFVVDIVHRALRQEEIQGAHPLNYHIEQIGTYPPFYIMYEKGSSILRMVANFLTPGVFRRGLQLYLEKWEFSNTVPSDLYEALQEAVNEKGVNNLLGNLTVAEIFEPWASNKGFPLVTAMRNYTSGSITFKQEPRFANWTTKVNWKIPISYIFSSSTETFTKTTTDYWLTDEAATINHNFPTDGWVIVNKQQIGYYRVNYDLENWERLIKFLNSEDFESIHVLNRAQLVDDSFSLAQDGKVPPDTPLRLCEYLARETDYIPWAVFFKGASRYIPMYLNREGADIPPYFKQFAQKHNLNSNFGAFGIFSEYVKSVSTGIKEYFKGRNESEDSHLDNFARYRLKYYFNFNL